MNLQGRVVFFLLSLLACGTAYAQSCPALPPTAVDAARNIFSDEQEQWLGLSESDAVESSLDLVPAPFGDDYLSKVGGKLLAVLPSSKVHFTFQIYESAELNAFSLPGGRVYISTKMISVLRDEDQLAALLAHELGHIVTRQGAEEMTARFRKAGIKTIVDQTDMDRKFLDVMASPDIRSAGVKEETGQDVADRVAIYALVNAGYRPQAFAELLDRTTGNAGKKGNRMMDLLGLTSEASRRYRAGRRWLLR